MKKSTSFLAILFPLFMEACISDEINELDTIEQNEISEIEAISLPFDFEGSESRTTINMGNTSIDLPVWTKGDTIGIYPSAGGDQLSFPIIEGIGTNKCVFTGGGWALKASTSTDTYKYTAYTPFNRNYYSLKNNTALPVNMHGQKQTGNDNSEHLGAYDLQIANGDTPTSGKISFKFQHKVAIVRMDITAPCPATWKSIVLESDADFTIEAAMNLSLNTPTIEPIVKSNHVTLYLDKITTTDDAPSIVAYMMMLPVDFTDKTLTMNLTDTEGNTYTGPVTFENPTNIVNPRKFGAANPRWISAKNFTKVESVPTFHMAEAGTLSSMIAEDKKYQIQELRLTGNLNGDDIKLICEMASSGKLTDLDLSEATIVEDGNIDSRSYGTAQSVIGEEMFSKATKLKNIKLPNNTSVIGKKAFFYCSELQVVTIPNEVIAIDDYAFQYCYSLTDITLPSTLTSIGEGAFIRCWALKKISIPDGVTTISADAFFDCYGLTDLTIGNNVTSIGDDAFNGCSKLTEIAIPVGVTSIGERAFSGCKSLTNITIPDKVTSIGESAFGSCSSLESITLGKSVSSIGAYAFYYCNSLLRIDIPDGVTLIDDHTFDQCHKLVWVTLPESVTTIGKNVFHGCSELEEITIPSKVTSIDEYAFYGCQSLKKINIPSGVTSISDDTFGGCSSLTNITLPNGLTSIGNRAFSSCTSLNNLSIPSGVTAIGTSAFSSCSFTNITIPNGVTSISDGIFKNCKSLASITIPYGVTSIGKESFYDCSALTSITIPDGVNLIEEWTFRGCSSLTSITIPKGIYYINDYAFYLCSSLAEVTCRATEPPVLGKAAFNQIASPATLYIPSGCSEAYNDNTRDWITYFSSIVENK